MIKLWGNHARIGVYDDQGKNIEEREFNSLMEAIPSPPPL